MQKYKILVTISKEKEENKSLLEAIYNKEKNYLYYVEDDKEKTVNIYDYNQNILKRDNLKLYLELNFLKNKITKNKMLIKDLNNSINLEIKTEKIEIKNKDVTIIYKLNDEKYLYKIKILEELKWV